MINNCEISVKKKSGIYKLSFQNYNHFYIGSAINLSNRKQNHKSKLSSQKHSNKKLQNVFNKYGMFNFQIIEYCDINNLIEREQHYLDTLNPHLNILKIAYSSLGYKHNENTISKLKLINKEIVSRPEVINKISKTWFKVGQSNIVSENTKQKLKMINIGKKATDETKQKMRDKKLGKKVSSDTKIKMSKNRKITPQKNWVKVCKLDTNDNIIEIYPNIMNACESLNVTCSRYIRHTLENKRETYKGFKWKYYKNGE